MSRDIAPFGVRMPPDLKERVSKAASESGRSINAEVVDRLEKSFEQEEELTEAHGTLEALIDLVHSQSEQIDDMARRIQSICGHLEGVKEGGRNKE